MLPDTENTENSQDGVPRLTDDTRFSPVSCADIRDWVRKSQPGARMTYGRGWHLSSACSADVAEFVVRLNVLGFASYHQNGRDRTVQGIAYLLVRSQKRLTMQDALR